MCVYVCWRETEDTGEKESERGLWRGREMKRQREKALKRGRELRERDGEVER